MRVRFAGEARASAWTSGKLTENIAPLSGVFNVWRMHG